MPTKPDDILRQLRQNQEGFRNFSSAFLSRLQRYREALGDAAQANLEELIQTLARTQNPPGAVPLEAIHQTPHWVMSFPHRWRNREQSLAWVRDRLTGIATFAADGSQIFPSKEVSIPVALVQVGWFENHHQPNGSYHKDIQVAIMTPADLYLADTARDSWERRVSLHRFEMETNCLIRYMEKHAHCENCLVFFDGSLVATYAETYDTESRSRYVKQLVKLLAASEELRVPLVAYIDNSQAADLVLLLQTLYGLPESASLHDGQLLDPFMQWGDRTPLFQCQRPGVLQEYGDQAQKVLFTYLKTTRDGYPARLEMPLWVHGAGWGDRILDWVRGEVIIGSGYPYVIETADQVAVLQAEDRQVFYRILQDWAQQENLKLRFSPKFISKVRRRL